MAILRKPPHKVLRRFTAPITYCLQRRALSETLYVDGYKKKPGGARFFNDVALSGVR